MSGRWQIAALAVAVGVASPLRAWTPTGEQPWPDGEIRLAFDLTRTAPRGLTGDWEGAAQEAMTLWNAKLERVQLARAPLEGEAWYENGRNEMFFDRTLFGSAFGSRVIAVSFTTHDRGVLVENDVVFNATQNWSVFRGPHPGSPPIDFRRVAVHELGHVLGLGHPDENAQTVSAVMNSTVGDIEAPTADDETGVRALYDRDIRVAPLIVTQPRAANVIQGQPVALTVLATGAGSLRYEWRRDGTPVPGATNAWLAFTAEVADAGAYTVAVSNAGGTAVSAEARVAVRAAVAPVFAAMGREQTAPAGTLMTLDQPLQRGDPPLRFEWRKNGVLIPGATTTQLTLPDVQFSDGAVYVLTARNVAGVAEASPIRLAITPPQTPRFLAETSHFAVAPGQPTTLYAPVDYTPLLTYQWLKDGVEIQGARGHILEIPGFALGTAGRYAVRVSNGFVSVTHTVAELSGFESASLTVLRHPDAVTAVPGERVSFSVQASGATRYQWLKNGEPLAGATDRVLTLPAVGYRDRGVYVAELIDGTRRVRSAGARLTVRTAGRLLFTAHPATHTVIAGAAVNLAGAAAVMPLAGATSETLAVAYQWFKDGQPLTGVTLSRLSFPATAAQTGRYFLRATAGAETVDSEEAEVAIVPTEQLIPVHPRSELFERMTEQMRLESVAQEVLLRRNGITAFYFSRDGVRVDRNPFSAEELLPGTYTLTLARGTVVETSRPFTLGYLPAGRPEIVRAPVGAVLRQGEPYVLQVEVRSATPVSYRWLRSDGAGAGFGGNELRIPAFSQSWAGDYYVEVRNAAGAVWTEPVRLDLADLVPPVIRTQPSDVILGSSSTTLRVFSWQPGARYQWFKNGQLLPGETSDAITLWADNSSVGDYHVVVTNGINSATSRTARVRRAPTSRAPEILTHPVDHAAVSGGDVTLSVGADGIPLPTQYQWRKDGRDLFGATDIRLKLHPVRAADAGTYTVVVRNDSGSATSLPARVTVEANARLINLATRASVGRGGDILIAGFVIAGREPRTVLVRGIGDQLSEFGVAGVLRDPVVSVINAAGAVFATNDDWFRTGESNMATLREAARQVGAFAQRSDARDGALLVTLSPGSYTVQVKGLADTTGVALVEIYEVGRPAEERMINLSSRAVVGRGANILIPGLVLAGERSRRLLVRAVGPGLADFGVGGALADPVMTVFQGTTVVATNDDWERQPDAGRLAPAMAGVGAFPLKSGSRDAALLLELPPGSYTVQVAGAQDTTGVALVEVYELP